MALVASACFVPALAQELVPPERGGLTESLGLPPRLRPHFTLSGGIDRRGTDDTAYGTLGLGFYKDLVNPVMTLAGFMLDGYGTALADGEFDAGVQAQLHMPLFRLAAGVDYSFVDNEADFVLSLIHPLQRGGVVFDGGMLRASWLPGRGNSFTLGIQAPFGVPRPGRGRPARDHVVVREVDSAPMADPVRLDVLGPAMQEVSRLGAQIDALLVPFLDANASSHDQALADLGQKLEDLRVGLAGTPGAGDDAPTAQGVVLAFHAAVEQAFAVALDPDDPVVDARAQGLAAAARQALLDEVLIPHNALLGQYRKVKTLDPFAARARGAFVHLMDASQTLENVQRWRAEWLFDRLVFSLEELRSTKEELWGDDRMVWLPMQLALLPEDYDQQEELDHLIERAAGVQFRSGNDVDYILNERFQWALFQSIHEANDYHVLWVHDFRGFDAEGNPDQVAFNQVRHGYMQALLERVETYDETGSLPEYHIFLDQWFYEVNK
jgi:hypothetical protein